MLYLFSCETKEKCFLLSDRRQMGPPIIFMKIPKTPNKKAQVQVIQAMNIKKLHQRDTGVLYHMPLPHHHHRHHTLHHLYSWQFKVRVLRKAISLLQLATETRIGSGTFCNTAASSVQGNRPLQKNIIPLSFFVTV